MHRPTVLPAGLLMLAGVTGCSCGEKQVFIYEAGNGEPARHWTVGDTASVWAEVRYPGDGGDVQCDRYGSRPAPDYRGDVESASFTFSSSRPEIASVTKSGLVTVLQRGETEITAVNGTASSQPLTITTQIVPPPP